MKNREDRTMTDLYDRTHKIPRLKIEGNSCKEPLDQSVNESGGINENNKSPSRKRSISDDDNPCRKPGSGTCNVCNTPCTSCLHRMRVDTDTCSFVGTCSEHFHCENAETESNLRNPIRPKPFDIGIINQEGQGENTSCITKHTKEKDIQRIDSHRESSDNCKEESLEKKLFDSTDSLEKSDSNFRVPQKNSACNEKMFGGLENCDKRDFSEKDQMQVQKVVEVKNQETDNGLIDVKVCDICGDTGREELLATCSRCIDGAEHTYCMRVRLEKLPEGDWLCEECQLKDKAEKKKKRHTETSPLSTPLPEKENRSELVNSKNPFSHYKKLRISTDRAVYTSVPPPSPHKSLKEVSSPGKSSNLARENSVKMEICSSKEVISPRKTSNLAREISLKAEISFSKEVISPRKTSNLARENSEKTEIISSKEVISPRKTSNLARENSLKTGIGSSKEVMSPRKTSNLARENSLKTEIGSSKELMSPRKTSNLCRENSMKMEICSLKSNSVGQFMKKSRLSRSYSLNHVSSVRDVEKSQAEMPPPKGTMTKQLSFKTMSMKPKIKSMTESIPTKQKTSGFSLLKPTEEARPFRRLIKSASLKEASSSCANTDAVKRTKPLSPTVKVNTPKLSEMSAEREKSSLENKYFKGESHTNVLAQQPSTVKKFEYKTEGSVSKKPDWGTSCSHMEPALEDKKMSKPVLPKQHEANKNPRKIPASKESDKKFNRLKTAVKTVPPEAKDGGNSKISEKLKVLHPRSGVSHNSKNQKAISIDVEEKSRSTFSDKSRVEKASKNVLSLASSVEKEESFDLDAISPNVGVEKMKTPKDVLSISSTLDKEKMVGIDVNTIAVGVEKMKAPKDMQSHNSENQKAISIDVEEKSRSTFSDKSRVEKASKNVLSLASSVEKEESFDLDAISPNVGVEKMKAPKDVLSISSTLDKEKMVGIDVNTIAVGVEKMKAPKDMQSHNSENQKAISIDVEEKSRSTFSDKSRVEKASKNVLSLASSVEKEESFDLDAISPNVGVEKMKATKDVLSISSTLDKEKMVGIDVNTIAVGVEKMKAPKDMLSQAQSLEKPMDSNGISVNVKNVDVKPSMPVVDESSLVKTPSEILAIPEQNFVWQGSFQILRVRTQAQESFGGIQAHLSTRVSPNVFEVVTQFSDKLQLEEVPSGTVWPVQFQKTEPSEEHVALFFFARDLESYETSYSRLLGSLIGDNLALRVDICGAELLIFPSDKLPKQSQRWNSLLYLWGIFRARKQVPSKTILNSAKLIGGPSGHFPTKINEAVKPSKELTIGDHLPKPEVENVADYLDLGREPCKKPVEQNALKCLDSSAFCSEQEALNASHASFTKICATQTEDANEKIASLLILPRKMAENIADDNKIMSLEKPRDAELKAGNKRPYLSDETSYEEMGLKKRKECDGFQIEAENKSSTLLKKLTSPKIHPLSIDLEKPADACDAYSAEDGESSSLRNAGWSKTGSCAIKVISPDDNNAPENKMPNLKLALGNKNPSHKEVLPLPLFPLARLKEEESDASPSLSLTIAPPGLEKGVERPVVKIQQFLPEKPGVKPLRLFGGYINP